MPVPPHPAPPSRVTMARGDVEKIDPQAGTITVRHGPVVNLRLPATTTVFRVKDRALISQVKQGDRINFSADEINGLLTVTRVELAK